MQWARKLLELGGIYMNIRALMAYDLLHNNHRYSKEFKLSLVQQYQKIRTRRLKYSRSSMG